MAYDLKIVGGTIVDGTGAPRFRGNVAVKDGVIVEVGKCDGRADTVVDAHGALVTPGFTDVHSHLDGQASWDEELAPSVFHGVTTSVMGNCGVGFAPVRESDHENLIRLMEGVEDIPGSALSEGITWGWESFPDYMDAIDRKPHTIDLCAQVPHDALRVYVMRERGVLGEEATEDDIEAMSGLMREALLAGATGFSTGRSDNHRSADGRHTPAATAAARELAGIARGFRGIGHGVLQAVSDFDMDEGPERFDAEFDVLEEMARASEGHTLSISLIQRDAEPKQWRRVLARAERADHNGIPMRLQAAPRAIGVLLGLQATFHPFLGFPSYKRIAHLPLAEQVARMSEPAFRDQLLTESSENLAGDGSAIPPLADKLLQNLNFVMLRLFRMGETPNYEPTIDQCMWNEAKSRGLPALRVLYDALLDKEGKELLYFPLFNYIGFNLDNVAEMLAHPLVLPGLSDAGAHVGTICDASFPTFLLTHWTRDRDSGRMTVERAVKMQAHDTARHIGLLDRGCVAPGQKADLNVIEMDRLTLQAPRMQEDLPAGGRRFVQGARGYRTTVVSGQVVVREGVLTGNRPGRLVRMGQR